MRIEAGLPGKKQAGMTVQVRKNLGVVKEPRGSQCDYSDLDRINGRALY